MSSLNETSSDVNYTTTETTDTNVTSTDLFTNSKCENLSLDHYSILFLSMIINFTIFTTIFMMIASKFSLFIDNIYNYLSLQHYICNFVHICLVCLVYSNLFCNTHLNYLLSYFEIALPMWTLVTSCLIFLHTFLFGFNVEVYSKGEVSLFCFIASAIVLFYKELISILADNAVLVMAIRMSSIFLLMSLPVLLPFLMLYYMFRKPRVPLCVSSFFLIHLLMFCMSDSVLAWFNIEVSFLKLSGRFSLVVRLFGARLPMEGVWLMCSNWFLAKLIGSKKSLSDSRDVSICIEAEKDHEVSHL